MPGSRLGLELALHCVWAVQEHRSQVKLQETRRAEEISTQSISFPVKSDYNLGELCSGERALLGFSKLNTKADV